MSAVRVAARMTATALLTGAAVLSSVAASTRRPAVSLENGRLINSRAGYYFTVPQEWILDSGSSYESAKVIHPESGAVFDVFYGRGSGVSIGTYFRVMQMHLESPEMHWLTMGKGWVTLGGSEAVGFRGTREKDGRKVKQFYWIALREGYVYIVGSTVELEKFETRATEIDQMYSTFAWGRPPKTP